MNPEPQPIAEPSDELPRPLRLGRAALVFMAGCFCTGATIAPWLTFPPVPIVRPKVEWLRQHSGDYDTLVIGSSRTYGAILPDLFDRTAAEAGAPTRLFNLGVNGMRPPEDTFLLETVLGRWKTPLKLVLVESNAFNVDVENRRGALRQAYWHDSTRSAAVLRNIFQPAGSGKRWWSRSLKSHLKDWDAFELNLTLFVSHAINLGRGAEWIDACRGVTLQTTLAGGRTDGYDANYPADSISDEEWKILRQRVADYVKRPTKPGFVDADSQRELRKKRDLIEKCGARMVLFLPPLASDTELIANPAFGPVPPVLNFNDPRKHPQFFERQNRLDAGHINAAGAVLFTRLLAGEVAARQRAEAPRR